MAPNYRVVYQKRGTKEIIEGTVYDDGLGSLLAVTTRTGEVKYLSVLDKVLVYERIPDTPVGPYAIAGDQRWV